MTIVEFLLARIADAQQNAERVHELGCVMYSYMPDPCDCGMPARVLAECAAQRAIVEEYRLWSEDDGGGQMRTIGYREGLESAVEHLAVVHAGHPDLDPAWVRAGG